MKRLKRVISMILSICLINTCFSLNILADEVETSPPQEETPQEEIVTLEPVSELPEEIVETQDEGELEIEVESENVEINVAEETNNPTEAVEEVIQEELNTEETSDKPTMMALGAPNDTEPELEEEIESAELDASCEIDFGVSLFKYQKPTIYYDPEDLTYKIDESNAGWYVDDIKTNYYYITIVNTGDLPLALTGAITQVNEDSPVQFYIEDAKELEETIIEADETIQIKISVAGDYIDGCDLNAHIVLKLNI